MEVIAGVASVAQLIRYAITLVTAISDLHEQIEGRPALLRHRIRQLESLGNTVGSVSKNSWLSTPIIREHIKTIVASVQDLTSLLEKELTKQKQGLARKYLRNWLGVSKEQQILETFNDLESGKSALLLSIADANTQLSGNIHKTLIQGWQAHRGRMPSNSGSHASGNSRDRRMLSKKAPNEPQKRSPASGSSNASGDNHQQARALDQGDSSGTSDAREQFISAPKDKGPARDRQIPQDPSSLNESRRAYQNTSTGNYYERIKTGNNSRNVNGNVGKIEGQRNRYGEIESGDNGLHINGNLANGAEFKASGIGDNK